MFGVAFDKTGFGLLSENGDSLYDEINTIEKKGNYGAPSLQPLNTDPELSSNSIKPLRSYYIAKCLTQLIYYDGNISPLKDKFLVGNLASNIIDGYFYAIEIDNEKKQIVEEYVVSLNNFPYNEITSIAQSPDGELYYGGYSINKINSVNIDDKKQVLFPIEINFSSSINVNNIYLNSSGNTMVLDIENNLHNNNSKVTNNMNDTHSSYNLSIKIPKSILNEIALISDTTDNKTMYSESTKDLKYNVIDQQYTNEILVDILVKESGHHQISIFANPIIKGS